MVMPWTCPYCRQVNTDDGPICRTCGPAHVYNPDTAVSGSQEECIAQIIEMLFDHDDVIIYDIYGPDGGC